MDMFLPNQHNPSMHNSSISSLYRPKGNGGDSDDKEGEEAEIDKNSGIKSIKEEDGTTPDDLTAKDGTILPLAGVL